MFRIFLWNMIFIFLAFRLAKNTLYIEYYNQKYLHLSPKNDL